MRRVYIKWPRGADIKGNVCATRGLAQTPFCGVCDVPKGHPRSPSPEASPRVYLNAACRSTIALTARVSCNSSPPVPTAGRRFSYPHASEGVEEPRCSGGLRPPPLGFQVYRRSESAATDRGSPAEDALLAHRLGPDPSADGLPYMHNNPVKRGSVSSFGDGHGAAAAGGCYFLHDASVLRMDRLD
jgi:hypothetical protein